MEVSNCVSFLRLRKAVLANLHAPEREIDMTESSPQWQVIQQRAYGLELEFLDDHRRRGTTSIADACTSFLSTLQTVNQMSYQPCTRHTTHTYSTHIYTYNVTTYHCCFCVCLTHLSFKISLQVAASHKEPLGISITFGFFFTQPISLDISPICRRSLQFTARPRVTKQNLWLLKVQNYLHAGCPSFTQPMVSK